MFCPNCGSETSTSTCGTCGTSLSPTPEVGARASGGMALAGWWRRVLASIVDSLVFFVAFIVIEPFAGVVAGDLVILVGSIAYFIRLLSLPAGQTLGNRAVGTQVRNIATGGPVSVRQAAIRWGGQFLPGALVALAYQPTLEYMILMYNLVDALFPLWDAQNQTIHDKLAQTVVVFAPIP